MLSEIHALQLLSKDRSDAEHSYHSYELNLVLEDGKRINVVDHGDETQIRTDAQALSRFLGKPVWDGIG